MQKFEEDLEHALEHKISLNPILNSFQHTVHDNNIQADLIKAFLKSMKTDLHKQTYQTEKEYKEYIYGSADVVGLMCLQVFVKGDRKVYDKLKSAAMSLGSAFQKVNFLRDLNADFRTLDRTYFPNLNLSDFDERSKMKIIDEIENDFKHALVGIYKLPKNSRLGSLYCLSLLSRTSNQAQKYTFSENSKDKNSCPQLSKNESFSSILYQISF